MRTDGHDQANSRFSQFCERTLMVSEFILRNSRNLFRLKNWNSILRSPFAYHTPTLTVLH